MYPAKIGKKLPSALISIISPFHSDSLIFFRMLKLAQTALIENNI